MDVSTSFLLMAMVYCNYNRPVYFFGTADAVIVYSEYLPPPGGWLRFDGLHDFRSQVLLGFSVFGI